MVFIDDWKVVGQFNRQLQYLKKHNNYKTTPAYNDNNNNNNNNNNSIKKLTDQLTSVIFLMCDIFWYRSFY